MLFQLDNQHKNEIFRMFLNDHFWINDVNDNLIFSFIINFYQSLFYQLNRFDLQNFIKWLRIDSLTNVYSITSMFIIINVKILFFNTQFINANVSSNKSFFIKNDEIVNFFVFVAFLTKIILFSNSLCFLIFSRSFQQFWIF